MDDLYYVLRRNFSDWEIIEKCSNDSNYSRYISSGKTIEELFDNCWINGHRPEIQIF